MSDTQKQGLDVELPASVAEGHYINLAIIAHSASEFIVDFASMLPGMPKPQVKSRVVMTPEHAKRLLLSLQENITRYETNMGKIELSRRPADEPAIPTFGEA